MKLDSSIYIAGHTGLVGSALKKKLIQNGYNNLFYKEHKDLDLLDYEQVKLFFNQYKPEYVFLCAAKVGGIKANSDYPLDFILHNIQIQNNIINACYSYNVKKLLFLGSSCIYPKLCPQPIKEEYLLTGSLEPTNEYYAIAKISGLLMCKACNKQHGTNYIAAMPTNLYGEEDNFNLNNSHVLPALIRKFDYAKNNNTNVTIWGTGNAKREFLYSEDLADAIIFMMNNFDSNDGFILNIGSGYDITIKELANLISNIVGFKGNILYDSNMPDGTPRKLLDSSKINNLGWKPKHSLEEGIEKTYKWFTQTNCKKL